MNAWLQGARRWLDRLVFVAAFGVLVISGVAMVCSFDWPIVHDAGLLHYDGWLVANGEVPYVDFFEMNFPGMILIHALVHALLGPSDLALRSADAMLLSLLFAFTFLALPSRRPRASPSTFDVAFPKPLRAGPETDRFDAWSWTAIRLAGAAFMPLYILSDGAQNAFQRDTFVALAFSAAAWCVTNRVETETVRRGGSEWRSPSFDVMRAFACGLVVGLSSTVKPTAILVLPLVGWSFGWRPRSLLAVGAGLIVVPGVVLGWLASNNALGSLLDIFVHYTIPLYAQIVARSQGVLRFGMLVRANAFVASLLGFSLLSTLGHIAYRAWNKRRIAPDRTPGAQGPDSWLSFARSPYLSYGVFLILGAGHVAAQSRGSFYHYYPLIWSGFLVVSWGILAAQRAFSSRPVLAGTGAGAGGRVSMLALTFVFFIVVALAGSYAIKRAVVSCRSFENRTQAIARVIEKNVEPGVPILAMDTVYGVINALRVTEHPLAGRFIYDLHFFHDTHHPYIRALSRELVATVNASTTKYILISAQGWGAGTKGFDRVSKIPGFAAGLRAYELVEGTRDVQLYRRKTSSLQ
ncbi:MAG: hypothetical protein H6729_01295 [Deltaproteobacteria bacterium]|nr:hypothetical protein [Deltaproteobacteria bacterium]